MKLLIAAYLWFLSPWISDSPESKRPVRISKWYKHEECGLWVRFGYTPSGKMIRHQWSAIAPKKKYRGKN